MNVPELTLEGLYKLNQKIGSGSFGQIYIGTEVSTSEEIAIKLEKNSISHPQLLYESRVYRSLQGIKGIPHIY